MSVFNYNGVQLDLARQKESIPYIKEFITFAADAGYNSILLYLEDRIRTASYPYISKSESYSVEEMKEIVRFAEEKKIDLVPCVATLGHAERFLAHKELQHLSEVSDDTIDRFGRSNPRKDVFCVSHPGFYTFIENYISEVAEIFPSQFFHAGLDEFFNFNLCPLCRELMPTQQDEEEVFLRHIIRMERLLSKLGKRMMIWSDMFEFYTTVLPRIPRNIVVMDWQYQDDVRKYLGHLFEIGVENRIAQNDSLGLDTVMACAECGLNNAVSTLKYADRKNAWGFLYTSWEKSHSYFYRSYPMIFFSGQLSQGISAHDAWKNTMNYIFGSDDPMLSYAVHLAVSDGNIRNHRPASESNALTRPFMGLPVDRYTQSADILGMLQESGDKVVSVLGKKVWKDICNNMEEKFLANELKNSFWDILDYGYRDDYYNRALMAAADLEKLIDSEIADWDVFRAGIEPNNIAGGKDQLLAGLQKLFNGLTGDNFMKIRFCMPDQYVVNSFDVEFLVDGKWITAASKNPAKSDGLSDTLFERAVFVDFAGVPEAVRLSVSGMGGRGISYFELYKDGKHFVPEAIQEVSGIVEHPEYLLSDDVKFTWFNTQCTRYNYNNPVTSRATHSVTLKLKEAEF